MAYSIVGFCFFVIAGLGWLPAIADTRVNETIVSGAFWLIGVIFLLYGGYATAQDIAAIWRLRTGRPYEADHDPGVPDDWPRDIAPPEREEDSR